MRRDNLPYYLVGDHPATTSAVLNAEGEKVAETRHLPYGSERLPADGAMPTDYRFTGQKLESGLGLYVMGARWYDPYISRWVSPDPVIPDPSNPQSLNRYSKLCWGVGPPPIARWDIALDTETGLYWLLSKDPAVPTQLIGTLEDLQHLSQP